MNEIRPVFVALSGGCWGVTDPSSSHKTDREVHRQGRTARQPGLYPITISKEYEVLQAMVGVYRRRTCPEARLVNEMNTSCCASTAGAP